MKARTAVLALLSAVLAFVISQAHADQMGDLCTILNTGRNNLAALNRQIANENNPLKKDALQQRIGQINQQINTSLDKFFKFNNLQLVNYTGTVSSISVEHYNTGPGVMLGITLPCKVYIAVQFIEISNPAWGNLNPDNQTPLPPFRPVLQNLAVHDTVTFSGRLPQNVFNRHFSNSPNSLGFFAVITDLMKGKIDARHVPPLSAEEALRIALAANAIQSNLSGEVLRSVVLPEYIVPSHGNDWKEFVGAAKFLQSTLKERGWSVSGFQIPSMGYYDIHGNIEPPDSARKWILGTTPNKGNSSSAQAGGYRVVFLDTVRNKVLNLTTHGPAAEAIISATYSGCTEFCKLWKQFRGVSPAIGNTIFPGYNPSFDFDATYTRLVWFSWDQNRGWHSLGAGPAIVSHNTTPLSKSASAGPSFPQSMLYRDVRSKLMEMGWRPFKLSSAEGCTWDNCKDFPETLVCYGVGRAPCLYTWERNSIQMIVTAVGEGDQTFAGTKICKKKIGQIPPPMGGWGCI